MEWLPVIIILAIFFVLVIIIIVIIILWGSGNGNGGGGTSTTSSNTPPSQIQGGNTPEVPPSLENDRPPTQNNREQIPSIAPVNSASSPSTKDQGTFTSIIPLYNSLFLDSEGTATGNALRGFLPDNIPVTHPPQPLISNIVEPLASANLLPEGKEQAKPGDGLLLGTSLIMQPFEVEPSIPKPPLYHEMYRTEIASDSDSDILSSITGCSQPLDLRSGGSSSDSRYSTHSTLSALCRPEGERMVCSSKSNTLEGTVSDICSFSNAIIIVLKNGHVLKEEREHAERVVSNIVPERLEVYNGYLYALCKGILFRLENSSFKGTRWQWKQAKGFPTSLTYINATLDGRHLWLQQGRQGNLYNSEGDKILEVKMAEGGRRVYGMNNSLYVDIHNQTATTSNGNSVHGVSDALLTHNNELIVIKKEDANIYRGLRLVNWKHYILGSSSR